MRYPKKLSKRADEILAARRQTAQERHRSAMAALNEQHPEINAAGRELARLYAQRARASLTHDQDTSEMEEAIRAAQSRRAAALAAAGVTEADLEPAYTCPLCRDRGVKEGGQMCECRQVILNQLVYEQLCDVSPARECSFENFELRYYDEKLRPIKKGVGAGCSGSANYYKQKGQFHTSGPQPGDQIFFTNDGGKTMYHTGIVEKVAGGRVYTIEGNTSSAAGVVENGGCVRDKSYALTYSKIGGYGRPDFSIVPEEDDDMDQNKFNEMFKVAMTAHQKELQDNDCGEWSREAREWAIRVGLFAGNGTTADGQPNYMWASPLTREQAAQLFYRFAQDHGLA